MSQEQHKYELDKIDLDMTARQGVISKFKAWLSENYKIKINAYDFNDVSIEATEINPIDYQYDISDADIYLHAIEDGVSVTRSIISNILQSPNHCTHYYPIRDYFEGLRNGFKGNSQIQLLIDSLHYADESRRETYDYLVKKWIVAAAACALGHRPNDVALGLISDRAGIGKTTFFDMLLPLSMRKYNAFIFKNSSNSLYPNLWATNILINLDELSAVNQSNIDAFKQLLSIDNIPQQISHQRRFKSLPRVASACFTSNRNASQGGFIRNQDPGLLRRLASVEIVSIDDYREDLNADMLWAEAVILVDGGYDYTWSHDDFALLTDINYNYIEMTNAARLIRLYYHVPTDAEKVRYMTSLEILMELKSMKRIPSNMTGVDEISIGKALSQIGYKRVSRRIEGGLPRYCYLINTAD